MAKSRKRRGRAYEKHGALSKAATAAAIGAIGIAVALGIYLFWAWNHGLRPGGETYVVKPGTSLRAFANELARRGVLVEPHSFVLIAYLGGHSRALKAGEYRFRNNITAGQLLDQVVAGRVIEYPLTILEGWNFKQVMRALADAPKLEKNLTDLPPGKIMAKLGNPDLHPEGRFYPDTYYYSAGQDDLSILSRAFQRMQDKLAEEWASRAPDLPIHTPDEALVLASIVEKETSRADERRVIAGVFVNRLRKKMRLQSDPTVIYGMGDAYAGNIRTRDLRTDTPYNTYTRSGLPPTPIAMPSGASIAAALQPAPTRALYFVSRNDGSHVFSETLEEHNAAVVKYQLGGKPRRNDKPAGAKAR